MIAVLIHDDLKSIDFNDLPDLCLNGRFVVRILNDLLDDPAPITMQANEQEFFLGNFVDKVTLGLAANLDVLLHHVIAKLVVDEGVNMLVKILKDLVLDVLVASLEGSLNVS